VFSRNFCKLFLFFTLSLGLLQTYVNGVLNSILAGPGSAALLCANSEVIIGGWWDGNVIGLNGKLDEIRLYNRVLTPHEITTLTQNFQVTSEEVQPKVVKGK